MRLDIEGSFACTARMFCLAFAVALVGLQAAAEELPPGFSPGIKPTPPPRSDILSDQALKSFARALEAADRDQWATARRAAADTGNQTASAIILWRQLLHDDGGATFDEAIGFVRDYPDWPRLNIILSNAEALLPDEAPARALIAAFAGNEPITGKAKIQLAKAYLQENQDEAAAYWVRRAWAETDLGSKLESEVLADLSEFLRPEDHIARMEWMMWNGRTSATTRLLPILDPDSRAIARAWIALRNGAAVSQAVAGVPNDDRDHPGLIFEQVSRHRKQGNDQAAIDTLKRAVVIDKIGPHGDKWWKERNLLARSALDEKRFADAYDVVSNPGALSGEDFAEAEWLAGWISLRFLNQPEIAENHFVRLYDGVYSAISQGRALYWSGRAAEAAGALARAKAYYEKASLIDTVFYGQLAKERLWGAPVGLDLSAAKRLSDNDYESFQRRSVIEAVRLLHLADQDITLRVMVFHLADYLSSAKDLEGLARLMDDLGYLNLSVRVGKRAARRHLHINQYAYPLPNLVSDVAGNSRAELGFVLGLTRQESEFDPRAVSSAGARGLMQLMPATAKIVAGQQRLPFNSDRLLSDPEYNLILGSAHLGDLVRNFRGSYYMAAAAYNAGGGRVRQWIERFGDPRKGEIDPIDWIELIPFNETRNYVQRVLENTQVYRARLGEETAIRLYDDLGLEREAPLLTQPQSQSAKGEVPLQVAHAHEPTEIERQERAPTSPDRVSALQEDGNKKPSETVTASERHASAVQTLSLDFAESFPRPVPKPPARPQESAGTAPASTTIASWPNVPRPVPKPGDKLAAALPKQKPQ